MKIEKIKSVVKGTLAKGTLLNELGNKRKKVGRIALEAYSKRDYRTHDNAVKNEKKLTETYRSVSGSSLSRVGRIARIAEKASRRTKKQSRQIY